MFAVDQGRVLDSANRPVIEQAIGEIKKSPAVLAVGDPYAKGAPVSEDGRITFATIQFRQGAGDVDVDEVKTMAEDTLELDGKDGVQVALGGDIIHWSTAEQGGAGEIFGILVAAVVLFLTLGVVAMGLPLLNALFAMVVSLCLMAVVGTRVLDVVDWTPQLAAMIGIGVGIDYALLILNRFRLERGAGRDVRDATLIAIDTSGRAVLFAGVVVVIAMLGMMLLGISFLYGPAIGAALAVLFTMFAALTLMPAIMGTRIGRRIKPAGGKGGADGADLADRETGFAARWSAFVARRPLPVAILALAVLIALALPGAPHAARDERREHVQEGRHHARRLRPAQGGLRRRASTPRCCSRSSCRRPATTRRCSRSATRCAARTASRRSCRRSSTSAATRRR